MALPLAVGAALAPDEVRRASIASGLRLRGLEPLALWMQTTGASLLAVSRCSSPRVWTLAQDSPSAYGLLYLAAVWADWRGQEHRQGRVDINSASLTAPEAVTRLPRCLRGP